MIFYLLVKIDANRSILDIISPDLRASIFQNTPEELESIENNGINTYLTTKLTQILSQNQFSNFPLTMGNINELIKSTDIKIDKSDFWIAIDIVKPKYKGSLSHIFGKTFIVLSVIFAVLAGSLSLIALIITANSSNTNNQNSTKSYIFAGVSSLVRMAVVGVMLLYSNAYMELENFGNIVTNYFKNKSPNNRAEDNLFKQKDLTNTSSCKKILAKLAINGLAATIVVGDQIISGITLYQEINGLGALSKKNNIKLPENFFFIYALIFVCVNSFVNGSFEASFFISLARQFNKWVDRIKRDNEKLPAPKSAEKERDIELGEEISIEIEEQKQKLIGTRSPKS